MFRVNFSNSIVNIMNALRLHIFKQQEGYLRLLCSIISRYRILPAVSTYGTTVDSLDLSSDMQLIQINRFDACKSTNIAMQPISETNLRINQLSAQSIDELEKSIEHLLAKNKDKQIEQIILDCLSIKILLSDKILKTLLKHYASAGRPDMITVLQRYFIKMLPCVYKRNGDLAHYIAKAQCLKGNSDKGLSIIKSSFEKNKNMRTFYRALLKELINDSIMNRSEASLVVFKKYVLEFSKEWNEHYPLICFWHTCWMSTWYSDQLVADELWETSEMLRNLISERVGPLCITALRSYYDDAVVRLMQKLLKYKMMSEYTIVLRALFDYKLKTRDLRGCIEIAKNCEVLGIKLPADQQGRYIKMLIDGKPSDLRPTIKAGSKEFQLKF